MQGFLLSDPARSQFMQERFLCGECGAEVLKAQGEAAAAAVAAAVTAAATAAGSEEFQIGSAAADEDVAAAATEAYSEAH
eukprot:971449-Amphidinium_carterae.1